MAQRPRKVATSWLEILRTVFAVAAGTGTLYLVAEKAGWL
jgi:hypothetical protein